VFCGGFTREAALEVVGASLRDLLSLINKSLLHPATPGRYQLHELLRQYGAERLSLTPEYEEKVRDRHSAHYSSELGRWATELKGARQREALDEMDLEVENARIAWHWAVAHGQMPRLTQGVDGIWLYHNRRLRHQEGEAAFRAAVRVLEGIDSPEAQRLRAKCLTLWGNFYLDLGKKHPSIELVQQGMDLLQELEAAGQDVRGEMALAMFHKARLKRYLGTDPLEAKESYKRSAALYEEVGDRWGLARALAYLGWVAEHLGNLDEAQALCERSLAIRRDLGDQHGMADAMLNLGIISWVQGRLDEAHRLLRESLGIFRTLDDWIRMAQTIKSIGEVLVRRGLFEDGLVLLESSSDIYDNLGYSFGVSNLLPFLAEAKLHLGHYEEAHADAHQAASSAELAKYRWAAGFSRFMDGLAMLAEGASHEALASFQESVAAFDEVRQRENRGWALGPLGLAAREAGDMTLARQSVVEALEIGIELGAFMPVMYGLPVAALLQADQGTVDRAVEIYACASRYEFVANSRWFEDLVGKQIRAMAASLPAKAVGVAQEKGRAQDWDAMAAELLNELRINVCTRASTRPR
jgi:tetratricopeptide (TPR) repeat protein